MEISFLDEFILDDLILPICSLSFLKKNSVRRKQNCFLPTLDIIELLNMEPVLFTIPIYLQTSNFFQICFSS
ncbi:hypothetical protein IGJ47_002373 [Enterococcus sp. AZ172]